MEQRRFTSTDLDQDSFLGGLQAARGERSIVKLGNAPGGFSQRGTTAPVVLRIRIILLGHYEFSALEFDSL